MWFPAAIISLAVASCAFVFAQDVPFVWNNVRAPQLLRLRVSRRLIRKHLAECVSELILDTLLRDISMC